ncbi:protein phosphatase 2C 37 [Pistacia vera]|uniref:protein phosphatase 2C 37 n=1 Tax=Pistacia vera TaxID=55513 RepID=UPI0012635B35|nr:protein phosphatase 2C 37 [Pistacia vera]
MAGICCGVVNETEPAAPVEPSSRTSRRRRLELRPFKLVADAAVQPPTPLENGRKRQRLELFTPVPRENCETNVPNRSRSVNNEKVNSNEALNLSSRANLVDDEGDESPKFGMTSVCGRRRDMEDAVSIRTSFYRKKGSVSANTHFFGVFDGHGCSHVAMKCKDRLHEIVKEELEACNEEETVEWKDAMERSYERMDKEVQGLTEKSKISSCRCELQTPQCDAVGSTAVVAVVTPDKIVVSNCGDSRAVLCRNGVAVPLSSDHKPDRPDELLRIQEAGGRVIYWEGPRVLGVLAMSRAIGDNYLKPFVIPEPEVMVTERTTDDECLILASDGLWDVVSNDTAVNVVRTCFRAHRTSTSSPGSPGSDVAGQSSDKACSDASILLTKLALARHSMDNVSVVVVDLRKNSQQQKP